MKKKKSLTSFLPDNSVIEMKCRIVFLSVADQKRLPFRISQHHFLPPAHQARKNIGYLYAMAQGAEMIFDMDWDNLPAASMGANGIRPLVETSCGIFQRPLLYKEDELTTVRIF